MSLTCLIRVYVTIYSATIDVPTGVVVYPDASFISPRAFLRYKYRNITRYTIMSTGGRHAAMQTPKTLAEDLFAFVESIED